MSPLRSAFVIAFLIAGLLAFWPCTASAASRAEINASFRAWLESSVASDAAKRGVSKAVIKQALSGLTPDWTLADLTPPGQTPREGPQRQAEFRGPARYFDETRLRILAQNGRSRFNTWSRQLAEIESRFGVPPSIVVAIWGRESSFGAVRLPYSAIRTLATEAFMGARKAHFYPELIDALVILEKGHVTLDQMKSSWAGALGQPQFLPSVFLASAVAFDGKGPPDIWRSVPDVLASIANVLKQNGWQPGVGWGFEVRVPAKVSCTLEGPDKGKTLAQWSAMGLTRADGSPIKATSHQEGQQEGMHLLMPAGRFGPAFLVTDNFYVLKSYNESDLYALFISQLADRIRDNSGPFKAGFLDMGGFSRADVRAMQQRFEARGVDVGTADGLVGWRTRIAVGAWQEQHGLPATCFPDPSLLKAVR